MNQLLYKINLSLSPAQVASRLSQCSGFVFFDSSGNLPEDCENPLSIISIEPERVLTGNIGEVDELQAILEERKLIYSKLPMGGAVGWISYEGEYCFGIYNHMLVYEQLTKQWWSIGGLEALLDTSLDENIGNEAIIGTFSSNLSREEYLEKVGEIHEYIKSGDIYQVNLTHKFSAEINTSGSIYYLYEKLRESSPAPMASYLHLNGIEVLSSSPETFVSIKGVDIETRPIKGTRPRSDDAFEDKKNAQDLLASEKEASELVMITDLERNDLGKICEFGSVEVPELLQLEALEHVYHLVSKVTGRLKPEVSHLQAIIEMSPGGSITGAPKTRAMEIINELETCPRGLYTGTIGYIGFNQVSQFNIAIRTLIREDGEIYYNVGAGIVADSDPVAEYEETLHKAKGIQMALAKIRFP